MARESELHPGPTRQVSTPARALRSAPKRLIALAMSQLSRRRPRRPGAGGEHWHRHSRPLWAGVMQRLGLRLPTDFVGSCSAGAVGVSAYSLQAPGVRYASTYVRAEAKGASLGLREGTATATYSCYCCCCTVSIRRPFPARRRFRTRARTALQV